MPADVAATPAAILPMLRIFYAAADAAIRCRCAMPFTLHTIMPPAAICCDEQPRLPLSMFFDCYACRDVAPQEPRLCRHVAVYSCRHVALFHTRLCARRPLPPACCARYCRLCRLYAAYTHVYARQDDILNMLITRDADARACARWHRCFSAPHGAQRYMRGESMPYATAAVRALREMMPPRAHICAGAR